MNRQALEIIREHLRQHVEEAVIKGCDAAEFLFVRHRGKAVEVSAHQEGGWWLEFWETSDDEHASASRDLRVPTAEDTIDEVMRWLLPRTEDSDES